MVLMVFSILFLVLGLGALGYGIYDTVKVIKNPSPKTNDYSSIVKKLAIIDAGNAVAFTLCLVFFVLFKDFSLTGGEWVELILGGLIFGFSLAGFIHTFMIHYYCKEIAQKASMMERVIEIRGFLRRKTRELFNKDLDD